MEAIQAPMSTQISTSEAQLRGPAATPVTVSQAVLIGKRPALLPTARQAREGAFYWTCQAHQCLPASRRNASDSAARKSLHTARKFTRLAPLIVVGLIGHLPHESG